MLKMKWNFVDILDDNKNVNDDDNVDNDDNDVIFDYVSMIGDEIELLLNADAVEVVSMDDLRLLLYEQLYCVNIKMMTMMGVVMVMVSLKLIQIDSLMNFPNKFSVEVDVDNENDDHNDELMMMMFVQISIKSVV